MNKDLRIVTNQVFLLGLDELYRTAMKRHESAELLECARNVASTLGVAPADVPIEGYYTESSELTEYFQLVRSLQDQPIDRETELPESEPYSRLVAVTSSPLFGIPTPGDSLLPSGADPLTVALSDTFPNWTIETLTSAAYDIASNSDDFSLVALAALSKDPVALTALRESVVLYAMALAGAAWSEPEYVWEVDLEIENRSKRFVETFNQLFNDSIPLPSSENAEIFWNAYDFSKIMGRCVRIGFDDSVTPVKYYHWAIDRTETYEHKTTDFWDHEIWTTQRYRETHMEHL